MSPSLPHPDPMALREALRVLRHGLRRGPRALRDTMPLDTLPEPAAQIAGGVLRGLGSLAHEADRAATGIARRLLVESGTPVPSLGAFPPGPEGEAAFARALYAALRAVLRRLGDDEAFVSEALARRAYARAAADAARGHPEPARLAADIALGLLDAQVVRDLWPWADPDHDGRTMAPVAVFAALLWMMSDRDEDEAEEALLAAADLAQALEPEIAPAVAARDRAALAKLFDDFASHV